VLDCANQKQSGGGWGFVFCFSLVGGRGGGKIPNIQKGVYFKVGYKKRSKRILDVPQNGRPVWGGGNFEYHQQRGDTQICPFPTPPPKKDKLLVTPLQKGRARWRYTSKGVFSPFLGEKQKVGIVRFGARPARGPTLMLSRQPVNKGVFCEGGVTLKSKTKHTPPFSPFLNWDLYPFLVCWVPSGNGEGGGGVVTSGEPPQSFSTICVDNVEYPFSQIMSDPTRMWGQGSLGFGKFFQRKQKVNQEKTGGDFLFVTHQNPSG